MSQPLIVLALTTLVYFGGKLAVLIYDRFKFSVDEKEEAKTLIWWKFMCGRVCLFLINFLYFPVVTLALSVFNCDKDPATGLSYPNEKKLRFLL